MTTATTIVELRSTLLQVPWRGKPPAAGILSAPFRDIYVLEIETQGGLSGMSYLMPLRGGLHTLDACMKELIAPHVIGRDATEIEAIWQMLYKSNFWLGRMGVTVFAQSAVDMALWDIVGKRAGLPLFRLWGAARTEIPAYGSGCFRGLGRDGMIARAGEFTAQGLKAIKMQVAHIRPWREDVQNVKAMREAMGGGIEIMIDVNMGWDADTAIQAGHRRDVHDRAALPFDHRRQHRLAAQEWSAHVDAQGMIESCQRHVEHAARETAFRARIVDQDVHAPESVDRGGIHALHRFRIANVCLHYECLRTLRFHRARDPGCCAS